MVDVQMTIDIDRSPGDVFAYMTDPSRLHEWQGGVIESRQESDGPMGVGTRIVDVRKFLGKRMESKVEVTRYDEAKSFDLKVIEGPIPFVIEHRLEPKGDEGTVLSVRGAGEPGGFFRFAESIVARQAQRQFESDFATLKDILEADRAG